MQILLVEDEAVVALSLQRELQKNNFTCITAATGRSAISLTQEHTPDLVIMDVNLSGEMNGIEAANRIRKMSSVPVCFITGYSSEDIPLKSIEFKPLAFLQKPINVDSILEIAHANTVEA